MNTTNTKTFTRFTLKIFVRKLQYCKNIDKIFLALDAVLEKCKHFIVGAIFSAGIGQNVSSTNNIAQYCFANKNFVSSIDIIDVTNYYVPKIANSLVVPNAFFRFQESTILHLHCIIHCIYFENQNRKIQNEIFKYARKIFSCSY